MTCIVGIEHEGKVTLGADSAGSNGWMKMAYCTAKLVRLELTATGLEPEQIIIGYTSSYRMGDILRYMENIPHRAGQSVDRWLIKEFIPKIRKDFRDAGFMRKEHEEETGGNFLIGVAGELHEVQWDFSVLRASCGFSAVGSGGDVAISSLYTSREIGRKSKTAEDNLRLALQAATDLTTFVGPPFHFMTVEAKDGK